MVTVLGIDPGTANCAFGVVRIKPNLVYDIVDHGMFKHPLKGMIGTDIRERAKAFNKELGALRRLHSVDCVIAERFMTRGRGGSTTIEEVSAMLGMILNHGFNNMCVIPAAQWKNAINKKLVLDELYEYANKFGIPAHRVDAIGLALYGASIWTNTPKYEMLKNINVFRQRLIKHR